MSERFFTRLFEELVQEELPPLPPLTDRQQWENAIRDWFLSHDKKMSFKDAETMRRANKVAYRSFVEFVRYGFIRKTDTGYTWVG